MPIKFDFENYNKIERAALMKIVFNKHLLRYMNCAGKCKDCKCGNLCSDINNLIEAIWIEMEKDKNVHQF